MFFASPPPAPGARLTDARLVTALAVGGLGCGAVAETAGRASYTANSTPPTSWFGLLAPEGFAPGDAWWAGATVVAAVGGLALCWLLAVAALARGRLGERGAWVLGGAWAIPLVVGPPLASKDVYAYAAQGMVARGGADPYRDAPTILPLLAGRTGTAFLQGVDPRWREVRSPYGPISTAVQHAAAVLGGGHPLAVLLLLRLVALTSVVVLALAAARLARRRAVGLVLVGLNPLLLVHGLSGIHLDVLMCALVLLALATAARGHLAVAVVLACLAGLAKAPAFLVVPLVVAWFVAARWRTDRSRAGAVRVVGVGALASAATLGGTTLVFPHAWGWVANLDAPTHADPYASLSDSVGQLLRGSDGTVQAAHLVGLALAALVVAYLGLTIARRPLAVSAGAGLLAVALLGPAFYPWYLLWGLVCLLPLVTASRPRRLLVGVAAAAAVITFPGMPGWIAGWLTHAAAVAMVLLAWRLPAEEPPTGDDEPPAGRNPVRPARTPRARRRSAAANGS